MTASSPYLITLKTFPNERGLLTVLELDGVQFVVQRVFFVSQMKPGVSRGGHSHRECTQILFCLNGEMKVNGRNSTDSFAFQLATSEMGLVVPPGNWLQYSLSSREAILMVLASHKYDKDDYVYELPDGHDE